ncbi:MAG: hypothetical protein LBC10_05350 [Deltaproteobacteria bacterium]|jgi:nickel transport protein|nr:hypothetical protein [Deltaproteobacteria bacterium]
MRRPARVCSALCLALCLAGGFGHVRPAQAHGVYIFAWLDGDRVCSESYFAKKSRVRDAAVSARDAAGAVLAEGRTDEAGLWCFPAPAAQDLVLTINAGQGHQAEFVLPAKAFAGATPQSAPCRQSLAERDAYSGPAWRDILGGLGWIVGLAGLAAWASTRRRT